jgi:ferredoxin
MSGRVSIDSDVCIGSGQCVLNAPSVFDSDEDGFGLVRPGAEDGRGEPMLKEAARACPVQAISLED